MKNMYHPSGLAGEPGVHQAWSGACDHVPFLGQHTTWAQAYVVCSRRAVLLRVAVALTSRLLLCRTSGCSRSATPLPTLLRHHTTWAQACDCVFSSFSRLVGWWRRFRVVGPLRLVVPWFPVDSRPTARWATFDHAWRGSFSAAKKKIYTGLVLSMYAHVRPLYRTHPLTHLQTVGSGA